MMPVRIAPGVEVGGGSLLLIAGPCVIESAEHLLELGGRIAETARKHGVPYVLKASFDKANRSALESFRGPGLEAGLEVLARARRELGVPVTTDVHESGQAAAVGAVVDLLQVPAFLCRQTDLLLACGATGRPVNVKKGQFVAPQDMRHVVDKLRTTASAGVLLTERGSSFGYHNLVVDMRGLPQMRSLGVPVVFDATHSVQLPGAAGASSGGDRRFIRPLARAALAVGVDALFLEVHERPERALSDGPNALPLEQLGGLLEELLPLHELARSRADYEL